jgi:DNA-binding ferritin-like protein
MVKIKCNFSCEKNLPYIKMGGTVSTLAGEMPASPAAQQLLKNPAVAHYVANNPNIASALANNPSALNQLVANPGLVDRLIKNPALMHQFVQEPIRSSKTMAAASSTGSVKAGASSFPANYEQTLMAPLKLEDTAEICKQLNILMATANALCIKTRGFSSNIISLDFYEHHSFFNLTIDYLVKLVYNTSERVRSLGEFANVSIADVVQKSVIQDVQVVVTDPKIMVAALWQDYVTISNLVRGIFRMASAVGDAGTIGFITGVELQIEHFRWELGVMSGYK